MKFSIKWLLVFVAGICFLLSAVLAIPVSKVYSVDAEVGQMPATDDGLRMWLGKQTGVVDHTIHIHRTGPSEVYVSFVMSQNSWGYPETPDLESAAEKLGYKTFTRTKMGIDLRSK